MGRWIEAFVDGLSTCMYVMVCGHRFEMMTYLACSLPSVCRRPSSVTTSTSSSLNGIELEEEALEMIDKTLRDESLLPRIDIVEERFCVLGGALGACVETGEGVELDVEIERIVNNGRLCWYRSNVERSLIPVDNEFGRVM